MNNIELNAVKLLPALSLPTGFAVTAITVFSSDILLLDFITIIVLCFLFIFVSLFITIDFVCFDFCIKTKTETSYIHILSEDREQRKLRQIRKQGPSGF